MDNLRITGNENSSIEWLNENKRNSLCEEGLTEVARVLIEKHNALVEYIIGPEVEEVDLPIRPYDTDKHLCEIVSNMQVTKPVENKDELIERLWRILDNIDSAGDIAKSDDAAYRRIVEKLQKSRWDTGVTISPVEGESLQYPFEGNNKEVVEPKESSEEVFIVGTSNKLGQLILSKIIPDGTVLHNTDLGSVEVKEYLYEQNGFYVHALTNESAYYHVGNSRPRLTYKVNTEPLVAYITESVPVMGVIVLNTKLPVGTKLDDLIHVVGHEEDLTNRTHSFVHILSDKEAFFGINLIGTKFTIQ